MPLPEISTFKDNMFSCKISSQYGLVNIMYTTNQLCCSLRCSFSVDILLWFGYRVKSILYSIDSNPLVNHILAPCYMWYIGWNQNKLQYIMGWGLA